MHVAMRLNGAILLLLPVPYTPAHAAAAKATFYACREPATFEHAFEPFAKQVGEEMAGG